MLQIICFHIFFEVLVLYKKEQMDILRHLLQIKNMDAKDFLLLDL